jgi:hypothetical protein
MTQPLLGIIATVIAIAVSLAYLALFDFPTFVGWVSFYMLALIPMQIVVVVLWGANPRFVSRMRQPAKGLMLLLVTALMAAIITPLVLRAVGEGVAPPGPIPSQYAVIVVPTTFFMAIAFGGWPFTTTIKHSMLAGLLLLAGSYLLTYAIFRVFFNYQFLQGAPVYLASAPHGIFNGVTALVFYVTMLAGMFLLLHFDLWPLTLSPAVMKQPILGLTWTAVALVAGALVMAFSTGMWALDPMYVLTRITAPFIFGTIVVLNMLEGSLFRTLHQPVKGLISSGTALVFGATLAQMYGVLAPVLSDMALPSGAPGYEYELWLVNALLSVTFPFLIFYVAYFALWPVKPVPAGVKARAAV